MAGAWSHRNREGQRRKPLFCSGSLPADGRHDQRNHRHLEYRQARRTRAPPSSSLPRVRPDGNENDDRKGHRGERRHDEGVEHVSAGTDVKHYAPRLRASAPSRRVRRAASSGTGAGAAGTVRSSSWRWLIPFPGTPIAGYSRRVRNGRFKIVGLDLKGGALGTDAIKPQFRSRARGKVAVQIGLYTPALIDKSGHLCPHILAAGSQTAFDLLKLAQGFAYFTAVLLCVLMPPCRPNRYPTHRRAGHSDLRHQEDRPFCNSAPPS